MQHGHFLAHSTCEGNGLMCALPGLQAVIAHTHANTGTHTVPLTLCLPLNQTPARQSESKKM